MTDHLRADGTDHRPGDADHAGGADGLRVTPDATVGAIVFAPDWLDAGRDLPKAVDADSGWSLGAVIQNAGGTDDAEALILGGPAAEYFLAKQPDGTVTLLRFVPVSVDLPDGMEVLRGTSSEYIQFSDRTIRVQDVPAAMTTGDTLPDPDADPDTAASVAYGGGAPDLGNVVSFGAAVAGFVRQGLSEVEGPVAEQSRLSVSVTPMDDAPVLTGAGAPVTYVKSATALLIAPTLTVGQTGAGMLNSARVEITGARPEDRLAMANWRPTENGQTTTVGNIAALYHNGALLLIGLASLAEYEGLLRMVGYANASEQPDIVTRSITVSVNDAATGCDVTVATVAVAVNPEGDGWVVVAPEGTETDAQAAHLAHAAHIEPTAPDAAEAEAADAPHHVSLDADLAKAYGLTIEGGTGMVLIGSDGADDLTTDGVDLVLGRGGNDRITLTAGSRADVVIDGGDGVDTLTLGTGVTAYGPATDRALQNVERIVVGGSDGAAINLSAQSEALVVDGGGGSDTITGGLGADSVDGGAGDDLFVAFAGDGSDVWQGDAGSDTISFDGVAAAMTIDLSAGIAQSDATGTDTLSGIENAVGGDGNDAILGDGGSNRLSGKGGSDTLTGGGGDDIFCFDEVDTNSGPDIITDFRPGDRLEITASKFLMGLTNDQISNGSWFWRGVQAEDLDDRLIYDKDSGYLIYDSNGNRDGGDVVQIARFEKEPDFDSCDLSWMDFLIT